MDKWLTPRWILCFLGIICIALTLGMAYTQAQYRKNSQSQRLYFTTQRPDLSTRTRAKTIHVSEVESVHLYGIHMGCFNHSPFPPHVVKEPSVIRLFVHSLQRATTGTNIGIGNGVDSLEIHFKPKKGQRREREYFAFNPQWTDIWYGPEFKRALDKLSQFQAAQVRQRARGIRIQQVKFVQFGAARVTDPQKLLSLLKAIQNVDARAFAYTERVGGTRAKNFESLYFVLRGGKRIDFRFIPSVKTPDVSMDSLWKLYE